MPPDQLRAACIRRAADLLGGFDRLAARLEVSAPTLERWAAGLGSPNDFQFLRLVDLLEEIAPAVFPPPPPASPPPPPELPKI